MGEAGCRSVRRRFSLSGQRYLATRKGSLKIAADRRLQSGPVSALEASAAGQVARLRLRGEGPWGAGPCGPRPELCPPYAPLTDRRDQNG